MNYAARFFAYYREQGVHTRRAVPDAEDFIGAAIAFAELCDCDEIENAAVVVTDCETGRERCFRIELSCLTAAKP